jgi:hypothetical protein
VGDDKCNSKHDQARSCPKSPFLRSTIHLPRSNTCCFFVFYCPTQLREAGYWLHTSIPDSRPKAKSRRRQCLSPSQPAPNTPTCPIGASCLSQNIIMNQGYTYIIMIDSSTCLVESQNRSKHGSELYYPGAIGRRAARNGIEMQRSLIEKRSPLVLCRNAGLRDRFGIISLQCDLLGVRMLGSCGPGGKAFKVNCDAWSVLYIRDSVVLLTLYVG